MFKKKKIFRLNNIIYPIIFPIINFFAQIFSKITEKLYGLLMLIECDTKCKLLSSSKV